MPDSHNCRSDPNTAPHKKYRSVNTTVFDSPSGTPAGIASWLDTARMFRA